MFIGKREVCHVCFNRLDNMVGLIFSGGLESMTETTMATAAMIQVSKMSIKLEVGTI